MEILLDGYGLLIIEGLEMTIWVSIYSIALATCVGLLGASAKLSSHRWLRGIATAYTTLIRGVPDLVLMLLVFFGGQMLVNNITDYFEMEFIEINPFVAGVFSIAFIFGAYMTETFRGAILSVPKGQMEAARAFGMKSFLAFYRILLPQMIRHALPGFGNNWLVLLKTTALVSVIGLDDMLRKASLVAGSTKMPFFFYLLAAAGYLALTTVSLLILSYLKKRYSTGV